MKILLITRYFPPLESIATNRMVAWVKYFHQLGHDITICTTKKDNETHLLPGVNVCEIPYFDPISFVGGDRIKQGTESKKTGLTRGLFRFYRNRLNERIPGRTDFWVRPAIQCLKGKEGFDLIISSYGPPSAHLIGLWAKRHFGCPWFADFRDLWVDNHNYKGIWPFTLYERFLEKKILGAADIAITVSEGLKTILKTRYPSSDIRVIPNGFDPDLTFQSAKRRDGPFTIVYTGTLFEDRHDPEPFLQAVSLLTGSNISPFKVLFYGVAPHKFHQLIDRYQLRAVVNVMGPVSHQKALKAQKEADLLLQFDFIHHFDGLLSGKVYEYLSADRPILACGVSEDSELGRLIANAKGGVLCRNSPSEIVSALRLFLDGRYQHESDHSFIDRFSRKNQAEEIISWALTFSQRAMSCSL